ncbi:response regulator [Myxococcota bacterium]|nr:response regulator [Myxococcota bacterium]
MTENTNATILVVDDSADNRIVIQALLHEAQPGYRVLQAANGPQALQLAIEHDPDVILLDIVMPGMDGFEVCSRLKANPKTELIPVIFITALSTDHATRNRAFEVGAEGFLGKPVEMLDLITQVRTMIKVKQSAVSERREKEILSSLVDERTNELEHQLLKARKVEQRARVNEHLLTSFIDTNTDLVFLFDEHMRFLMVNTSLAALLKLSKNEIIGRHIDEVVPAEMKHVLEPAAQDVLLSGAFFHQTHSLYSRYLETNLFRVQLTSGCLAVGGICRDVTDRFEATRQLELAAEDWQHTFDSSNEAICILNADHRIVRANRIAKEVFNFDLQAGPRMCWDVFHEDKNELADCPYARVRLSHHRESEEIRFKDRSYRITVDPIFDTEGRMYGAVHMVSDITGRKQAEAERERLESQLLQAQKMESVGQLAGGVAHDFNNMLSIILGNAENACDQMSPEHPAYPALQEILLTAKRSAELTRQLLAFARKQEINPRVLELNETIKGLLSMISRLIGEQIRIQYLPQEAELPIYMDPSQLNQILVNLAVNARDAIGGPGTLTIETARLPQEYTRLYMQLPPGDWAQLRVTDNGCGMSPDLIAHVFEPFFTTKEQGKGTGLGLATVWGIVKQNNGFIKVESTPGRGTTFTILLSLTSEMPEPMPAELSPVPSTANSTGTILLVEDEPTILKLTQRILAGLGHRVLIANSPLKALDIACEHASEISLLITDVIMPDLNGHELASRLLAKNPALQVLFISGYPADYLKSIDGPVSNFSYLSKPFTRAALAAKLQDILSQT